MTHQTRKRKDEEPLETEEYRPRTALGRRLARIRKRIVAAGEPLLDWDGVERELADRRGTWVGDAPVKKRNGPR